MSQDRTSSSTLPQPLRALSSGLHRLPGAEQVSKVADGALDRIGAVSPRGRRMAVYTGAGVLGVTGVVEWPLALTGAAVAWLTQPHPRRSEQEATAPDGTAANAEDGTAQDGRPDAAAGSPGTAQEARGPGDRLATGHSQQDRTENARHDQPAKVGDPATTSALRKVAEATTHHDAPEASP